MAFRFWNPFHLRVSVGSSNNRWNDFFKILSGAFEDISGSAKMSSKIPLKIVTWVVL